MATLKKHGASNGDGGFYIYDQIELDAAFKQYQGKFLQTLEGADKRLGDNITASMGAPSIVKRYEFELGQPLPRTDYQVCIFLIFNKNLQISKCMDFAQKKAVIIYQEDYQLTRLAGESFQDLKAAKTNANVATQIAKGLGITDKDIILMENTPSENMVDAFRAIKEECVE